MKHTKYFTLTVVAAAVFAFAQIAQGQTEGKLANMNVGAGSVRWDILVPNGGGTLTITAPDGRVFRRAFRGGASPEINLSDKQFDGLADGVYTYELQLAPALSPAQKEALMKARGNDDDPEAERAGRKRPAVPLMAVSGSFAIAGGMILGPGAVEGQRSATKPAGQTTQPQTAPARVSANTITRLRNHRLSLFSLPDIVQADDVIIQGSLCVGLDCVNNETFNFDTIRLKENNTRISFNDTSTSAGFPTNDWTIRANDSASGGASYLAFVDRGTTETGDESGTIVFRVDAGAPANSLKVSSTGKVGIRTATPGLDVHVNSSDTPAFRMEQNNSGGFTAQTWDIGANEANWFVRDVTGGSRLPFRIRPGAPTSSVDISASGNVGIGTASPGGRLAVTYAYPTTGANWTSDSISNHSAFVFNNPNGAVGSINTSGSATTYNTSSDMRLKENITPTKRGLSTLLQISVTDFNFIKDSSQRVQGFLGQDLYKYYPEAVLVGGSDPAKAPWQVDYARVTPLLIQSVKDLNAIVAAQGDQIKSLETQLKRMKPKHMTRKRKS